MYIEGHAAQAILITDLIYFSYLQFERILGNIAISPNTLLSKESRFQNSILVFIKLYGKTYIKIQRLSLRGEIIFQFVLIQCPNGSKKPHRESMKFTSNSVLLFIRDLGGLAPGPFMQQALEADLVHTPSTDPPSCPYTQHRSIHRSPDGQIRLKQINLEEGTTKSECTLFNLRTKKGRRTNYCIHALQGTTQESKCHVSTLSGIGRVSNDQIRKDN